MTIYYEMLCPTNELYLICAIKFEFNFSVAIVKYDPGMISASHYK